MTAVREAGRRGTVARVWDAHTTEAVGKPLAVSEVGAAAASGDGSRVVLGHSYWLGAWDTKPGERLHPRFVVYGGASYVAMTPDGSRYAAGFADRDGTAQARVWDAATGDAVSPPMKTERGCSVVRFAADGRVLLTVTDQAARLWDARTGEPLTRPLPASVVKRDQNDMGSHPADVLCAGDVLLLRQTFLTSQYDAGRWRPGSRPVADLRGGGGTWPAGGDATN